MQGEVSSSHRCSCRGHCGVWISHLQSSFSSFLAGFKRCTLISSFTFFPSHCLRFSSTDCRSIASSLCDYVVRSWERSRQWRCGGSPLNFCWKRYSEGGFWESSEPIFNFFYFVVFEWDIDYCYAQRIKRRSWSNLLLKRIMECALFIMRLIWVTVSLFTLLRSSGDFFALVSASVWKSV